MQPIGHRRRRDHGSALHRSDASSCRRLARHVTIVDKSAGSRSSCQEPATAQPALPTRPTRSTSSAPARGSSRRSRSIHPAPSSSRGCGPATPEDTVARRDRSRRRRSDDHRSPWYREIGAGFRRRPCASSDRARRRLRQPLHARRPRARTNSRRADRRRCRHERLRRRHDARRPHRLSRTTSRSARSRRVRRRQPPARRDGRLRILRHHRRPAEFAWKVPTEVFATRAVARVRPMAYFARITSSARARRQKRLEARRLGRRRGRGRRRPQVQRATSTVLVYGSMRRCKHPLWGHRPGAIL